MMVDVNSEVPPGPTYYGQAGVDFAFIDASSNILGQVVYVAATTSYPFTLFASDPTISGHSIVENVMTNYALSVSDMLSEITIDHSLIAGITMYASAYSSTNPYPYVSAEVWIDNVSTVPPHTGGIGTSVPEPGSLALLGLGLAGLGFSRRKRAG